MGTSSKVCRRVREKDSGGSSQKDILRGKRENIFMISGNTSRLHYGDQPVNAV
jgi:hypothetical protein